MKPTCCNRNATPYRKVYREAFRYLDSAGNIRLEPECWEEGFRCKVCGRVRIPIPTDQPMNMAYMNSLEAVRLAGIEFDKSLSL